MGPTGIICKRITVDELLCLANNNESKKCIHGIEFIHDDCAMFLSTVSIIDISHDQESNTTEILIGGQNQCRLIVRENDILAFDQPTGVLQVVKL